MIIFAKDLLKLQNHPSSICVQKFTHLHQNIKKIKVAVFNSSIVKSSLTSIYSKDCIVKTAAKVSVSDKDY